MNLLIEGANAYCYDAGGIDARRPTTVLIHGAGGDHSVWSAVYAGRHFTTRGLNVLAPDLPGHGRSGGMPAATVEAMATWLLAVLDAAGVDGFQLAGHSLGSLLALELVRLVPARVTGLALLGCAWPMAVSDTLLATALADPATAIDMVNHWSHAPVARKAATGLPGFYAPGEARRLRQRIVLASPQALLHADLQACNAYQGGEAAAAGVRCPVLIVSGRRDMMTPPKAARRLAAAMPHARQTLLDAGHELMAEQPQAVRAALAQLLAEQGPDAAP